MQAEIIGPALQQRRPDRNSKRLHNQWKISEKQLILERFGAGRDDDTFTIAQGGNQVRQRFANTRPCFNDQLTSTGKGFLDGYRHFYLGIPWGEPPEGIRKRAVRIKQVRATT